MTKHSETKLDEIEARVAAFEAKISGLRARGRYSARDEALIAKWEADVAEAKEEIAFQRTWPSLNGAGGPK